MNRSIFLGLFILAYFFVSPASGAKVDTVNTFSQAMKKSIKAVVITPDNYAKDKKYPVVYLLHGADGDYSNWVNKVPEVAAYSDLYEEIIVCPDGGVNSWYFDSPINSQWKYETYIVKELVPWVDAKYSTISLRSGRAITGLSMGGHGALYLAFKHQDIFGAAGSMSGGIDIRPFPKNWKIDEKLGSYAEFPENWEKNTVINMVHLLTPNNLTLIIDCGTDDFFYEANVNLHEKLLERNIPHDFISRPGSHNWSYWENAVKYQMLFFDGYFKTKNSQPGKGN